MAVIFASPKQVSFLDRLAVQKDWETGDALTFEQRSRLTQLIARQAQGFTSMEASKMITALLAAPSKVKEQAEPGYYVKDGRVFVVVLNKAGTRTYAKEMIVRGKRGRWTYAPGVGQNIAHEGLVPLTLTEAIRLGRLHGACMICGRQLTDPESVEAGIGPVCKTRI